MKEYCDVCANGGKMPDNSELGSLVRLCRLCHDKWKSGTISRLSPLPDNSHYAKLKMQPWDYIIANELNFFEGSVIKYVSRWRHKNGLDDLRKARVYIDELIRQEEAK